MIFFLAPLALSGLAMLAVPIIIHLLKPRRVRVVPFSSLRWLHASQHRFSRRIQWHQLLLFLLRVAILALLVLAAARPVLRWRGGHALVQRFVIMDTGRAMAAEFRGQAEPMTMARRLAGRILAGTGPGRQTTVLIAGHAPRALGPLSADPVRCLEKIRSVVSDGSENPVTSALRLIPVLHRQAAPARAVDLIFITANLATGWGQADIAAFLKEMDVPVHVQVINTSVPDPQNAWISSAAVHGSADRFRRRIRVQLGAVGDRSQARTLRLSGIPGTPDMLRDVTLESGRINWQEFDLPPVLSIEKSPVALLTLEPPDGLADDDQYPVALSPRAQQTVLLVEPEGTHVRELQPAFHLRTALETLAETLPDRFSILARTPRTFREADLSGADLIFWVEPSSLTDAAVDLLRERISGGAALVVFTGPSMDVDFFNRRLFNPLQPAQGLMTRPVGEVVRIREASPPVRLYGLQWEHPMLASFADPAYGDLALAGFNSYRQLPVQADSGRERILASFPDQTPAIIETSFGAGRVLLLNTTANDAWSNLPRQRGFVPLLDSMMTYLTGATGSGRFCVGEPLRLALPPGVNTASVRLLDPQKTPLRLNLLQQGGRHVVQVSPVMSPGVYVLAFETDQGESVREPVVVQSGRVQSALTAMDEDVLRSWWAPAEISVQEPESAMETLRVTGKARRLESLFLVLALLALLAETVICCHLCPRAKPGMVAESTVSRRGFFAGRNPPDQETAVDEEGLI